MIRYWRKLGILIGIFCIGFSGPVSSASSNTEGIRVFQKNERLSPEHKQSIADDLNKYRNAENIWGSLRDEFALPHYEDNPLVQEKIAWFLNHQDYLIRSANRAAPYMYYILQQVKKRHLPAELVLLPIMESAYNPFAYSPAGAAGIWQLMPGTASGYGIRQNRWYDGRRDVIASTKAALDHLAYLQSFFEGNWLLALAAYDTGEGNVIAAIRKNIRNGDNTDYWSLPLAQETRDYLPQLLALAIIISHPYRYPIDFPAVQNAPYLAQVDIGAQMDLKHAANLAGLSFAQLKQLNPGFSRSATGPHGPYKLVLPIENVERFSENMENSPLYERIDWGRYKIRSGDTLVTIAKKFNTTPAKLRKMNPRLAANLKPGKKILIPYSEPDISNTILAAENTQKNEPLAIESTSNISSENTTDNENQESTTDAAAVMTAAIENSFDNYAMQPGDTLYMVRKGDTFQKIASRFHISTKTLMAANKTSTLHNIQQLIIPTHLNPQRYKLTPGDTIYMVRNGDTIEKIARKFHTTPSAVRLVNLLANNDLQEGDRLVIPTHV